MCIYIYVYVCVSGAPIQFFLGQCRPPSLTSARFCFSRTAQIVDVSVHAVASSYDPHRVQELYKAFLKDSDFVEKRFQKICKQQGVGPQKLARYRARGKVNDLNERLYIYMYGTLRIQGSRRVQPCGCAGPECDGSRGRVASLGICWMVHSSS